MYTHAHTQSSVQLLSCICLFATPWTAARQAFLSITNPWSLLKLIKLSIESVMPSNHLILCHPLLFLTSIFLSIRVFSKESVLHIRWPKYWSFSFSISPSNEDSGLISFRIDRLDLLAVQGTHTHTHKTNAVQIVHSTLCAVPSKFHPSSLQSLVQLAGLEGKWSWQSVSKIHG